MRKSEIVRDFLTFEHPEVRKSLSLYVEDYVLYSFNRHYPLAMRYGACILINRDVYITAMGKPSKTTATDRNNVARECMRRRLEYKYVTTEELNEKIAATKQPKEVLDKQA